MSADRLAFLPDESLTFIDVFGRRESIAPEATVITELASRGTDLVEDPVTVGAIGKASRRALARLLAQGVGRGDRIVLAVESPREFLAWFVAIGRLGAIPVPLPSMSGLDAPSVFVDRIRSVARDCTPAAILVDDERSAEAIGAAGLGAIPRWVAGSIDDERGAHLDRELPEPPSPSDVAFLQYTSGSTGDPKGVIVTHANLVANFRAIAGGAGFGPEERSLSWLPLYHDMGLIGGFLLGIYMSTGVFVMRPKSFVFRPDSWLRAMSRVRATFTVAPNFAYSLVGRKLPESVFRGLDLSSLRLAFNGAEPIDRPTVDLFVSRLMPYGLRKTAMYPVYGLAECTLAVAFPAPETEVTFDHVDREQLYATGDARASSGTAALTVTSVGRVVPGHRVRILALDSDRVLPDRTTGEVAVSGPSISPGYFGRDAAPRTELRTGDLGYLVDGRLFLVDRIKDLVILRGKNFAPSDLERTVAEVDGITRGAIVAFGVRGDEGTESLVVVAALDPSSLRSASTIRADVSSRLTERFGITGTEIRLVEPGTIPKTSSGKVRRRECQRQYEANELADVETVVRRATLAATKLGRRIGTWIASRE